MAAFEGGWVVGGGLASEEDARLVGVVIVIVVGVMRSGMMSGGDVCGVSVGSVCRWWGGWSVVHGGIIIRW